ncbi:uncharacterized protein sb:cb1058 [Phyllopteryx taeniolatus]|uniref:uncharacterized protein sb:cb1058 n=1 Tax=Phyllopteryx taeniolatus TaxID=161469 RepID=UPI002AD40CF2|nr:uncharacterized protein sb:cb1058 [Phyllopteryx taeniolatus]
MTIGKDSRKSSVRGSIRAPKFLDKSSGLYGRLDEPESAPLEDELDAATDGGSEVDACVPFDPNEGTPEDDGETLLRGTPGGRWRRGSSGRKPKQGGSRDEAPRSERPSLGAGSPRVPETARNRGNLLVDADDQVLIRDKKRTTRGQEEVVNVLKRNTMKTYRKAADRAFRRGWEAFVANIYSVTLTPSTRPKTKLRHNVAPAELQ